MSIYDQVKDVLENIKQVGDILTIQEIKEALFKKYKTEPGSVILSDYCYNRYNSGITTDRHLLEFLGQGKYKYLGEGFNYNGNIYHKPYGYSEEHIVGYWKDGVKTMYKGKEMLRDRVKTIKFDCIAILDFLEQYAGRSYTNPNKIDDEAKKDELDDISKFGKTASNEFQKLVMVFDTINGFKVFHNKTWLDGSNIKVRRYFWAELKKQGHEDSPTSISIFAENLESSSPRFRFSIELKEKESQKSDYEKHHRILDLDLSKSTIPLRYYSGGNNDGTLVEINKTSEEVKDDLKRNVYRKVQISHIITKQEIEEKNYTNEEIINKIVEAIDVLEPFYDYIFKEGGKNSVNGSDGVKPIKDRSEFDKNIILYGPPGTGKTYNSINYAVAIVENRSIDQVANESHSEVIERYNQYKQRGLIAFTTFHQSYGYEEFIEGIKPVMLDACESNSSDIQYEVKSGIFKEFCERAQSPIVEKQNHYGIKNNPVIWKVSLQGSGENAVRRDCFNKGRIRIGWDDYGQEINEQTIYTYGGQVVLDNFIDQMEIGDIVFTLYNNRTIDAIGVVKGNYEWLDDVTEYRRSRKVQWIFYDKNEDIVDINGGKELTQSSVYRLRRIQLSDVINILAKHHISLDEEIKENESNYVFIIDEINRGNISKIFGELITLIEPTKRLGTEEAMNAALPYSPKLFGVPNNVYLLGTMNSADRSIALMDTALRRRFQFVEMMPTSDLLAGIMVGQVNIRRMFEKINTRIEYLFDREHTIGHSYLLGLKSESTIDNLAGIFKNSIIPLLQEYFYEDYSKIQLVLGDNAKDDEYKFIKDEALKIKEVFKGKPDIDLPEKKYSIQSNSFYLEQSYIQIYE